MKKLTLVRHGKSSWDNDLPDHKRPLKKRAFKDAEVVLDSFQHYYTEPAMFWTSPAVRAHTTAKLFKERLEVSDENFKVVDDLYTFNQNELLRIIQTCPDHVDRLFVFGHNPGMTILVNLLGDKKLDNLPTTGLCVIEFQEDSWSSIRKGKTLVTLLPKNLR